MKTKVVRHTKGLLEVRTQKYIVQINVEDVNCKGAVSIVRVLERRTSPTVSDTTLLQK
jgi:hypothetical protein